MPQNYRMTWNGRRMWTRTGRRRAAGGLQQALEHVLNESNKIVPLDEGTLQRSGTTSINATTLTGTVSYDTPYAVRQHEEVTWRHAPGRQAKYLETAVNSNQREIARIMQSAIRGWTL